MHFANHIATSINVPVGILLTPFCVSVSYFAHVKTRAALTAVVVILLVV